MLVIAILVMMVLLLQKVKTCWMVCILRGINRSKGFFGKVCNFLALQNRLTKHLVLQ